MSRERRTARLSWSRSHASRCWSDRSSSAAPLRLALVALGLSALGCFKPDDGREPPLDRIYFPTGLALSPDGDRLYVANSDWDLQFNAGSVQVYDAARLRELLPRACSADADCTGPDEICDTPANAAGAQQGVGGTYWCVNATSGDVCRGLGVQSAGDRLIQPGLCGAVENRNPELLLDSVGIGAFATDLVYRPSPLGGGRLFVPVRSDATLHWLDVPAGTLPGTGRELECGQGTGRNCDANHRRGDGANEETPSGSGLPIEPYAVAASTDGETIVLSHQTEGKISLFTNDWAGGADGGPQLSYILEDLGGRPVHISAVPIPQIALLDRAPGGPRQLGYQPGYWVTFRGSSFVQLLRYFDTIDSPTGQPFLGRAVVDAITTTLSSDVRAMASDDSARRACETGCGSALDCLAQCSQLPLPVYLANRAPVSLSAPGSLLIGSTMSTRRAEPSNDRLQISDLVAIDDGPSRVSVGQILDERGEPRRRVFLTSFDSNVITIFDPEARMIDARVPVGRGPSALVVDEAHAIAYVSHFTDSYIGVIDLDARHASFGTLILALGDPTAPRGDDR
jgi:DNA-binding beta-propeller fold protein YncE